MAGLDGYVVWSMMAFECAATTVCGDVEDVWQNEEVFSFRCSLKLVFGV